MSKNIHQVYIAHPTTTFVSTDLMYLGRSPYGATDDYAFTYGSLIPITTKGDIMVYGTAATRLAVGSTNGQILQVASGAATGLAWSTPTYPSASGTAGKILRSDGTNNVYSTSTFADTYTINTILYAGSANTVSGLASAQNGVLVSGNTNVPVMLAGPGTTGNILQSNAAAAPSFSTATYPSVATSTGSMLYANGTDWVASTSLWPNTVGSAGKIVRSDGTTNAYSTATYPDVATSTGSMLYANGTNWVASTSLWPNTVGTAGKILRSDGTTNAYTTSTFADTYAVSTLLYAGSANAVSGLATANSATLVTNSTGVPAWTASMTNGQVLVGSTGATPVPATIGSSGNISISTGAGSLSIGTSGFASFAWSSVSINTSMAVNTGYITSAAGVLTMTLPSTAAVGSVIRIAGQGAGGWSIAQNANQTIHFGSSNTTTGVGGSLASTNRYDSVELVCTVANLDFVVVSAIGNLTVV